MKKRTQFILCLMMILWSCLPAMGIETQSFIANVSTSMTRSHAVESFIEQMQADISEFDESTLSRWFAYSYVNLNRPGMIIDEAHLILYLSALSDNFSYNDMILLYFFDNNDISDAWEKYIGSQGPNVGILPYRWELGQTESIDLNFKELMCRTNKTVLKAFRENGHLDVMVQDDTRVQELNLLITYKTEARLSIGNIIEGSDHVIYLPIIMHNPDQLNIQGIDFQLSMDLSLVEDRGFQLSEQYQSNYKIVNYNSLIHKATIASNSIPFFDGEGEIGRIEIYVKTRESKTLVFNFDIANVDQRPVETKGESYITNRPPIISTIENQTIFEDQSSDVIFFTVDDENVYSLTINSVSNNHLLIPKDDSHITISGQDENRQLILTPLADNYGTVTITIIVTDTYGESDQTTFSVSVENVNDPPDFTMKHIQPVFEDSSKQSISDFIENSTAGVNESHQNYFFQISVNNRDIFSLQPQLNSDALEYELKADMKGDVQITICCQDDGGTENGGQDTTCHSQTMHITPVNDPPVFTLLTNEIEYDADDGPFMLESIIQNESTGPNESDQIIVAYHITEPGQPDLFDSAPSISSTKTLSFTPKPMTVGEDTVYVSIQDNGDGDNISEQHALTIRLKGYSIQGKIQYFRQADKPVQGVGVELIDPSGNKHLAISDENGSFEFNNLPKAHYTIQLSKSNNNEILSALDASLMSEIVVEKQEADCYTRMAGNIFRDNTEPGALNVSNIALYSANKISCLNDDCVHWMFAIDDCLALTPDREVYTKAIELNDNLNLTFYGIFLGDISGNIGNTSLSKTVKTSLESTNINVFAGDTVHFPLQQVWDTTDIKGVDININYQSDILAFQSFEQSSEFTEYSVEINSTIPGKIKIVVYSSNAKYHSNTNSLGNLIFEVIGQAGSVSDIQCVQFDINEIPKKGGVKWAGQVYDKINISIQPPPPPPDPKKWRLFSIPVTAQPSNLTAICKTATEAFKFNNGEYIPVNALQPGIGYWIKAEPEDMCVVEGTPYTSYTVSLEPGWHLIGSIDSDSIIPLTFPENAIAEMYTYKDGAYVKVIQMERGYGYWIKIIKECILRVGQSPTLSR